MPKVMYIQNSTINIEPKKVQGEIVTIAEEKYYKISNYDMMSPFFMNIVSDCDLWMFISSNGSLSAGRCSPDDALFPYYTDDRINDSQEVTGSKTIVIVNKDGKDYLWEPFSSRFYSIYESERNIYKNVIGNKLIFEEVNKDLGLCFQYTWLNCDRFGFIKQSRIINNNSGTVAIRIVDGIQNILPAGVNRKFQLEYSTLVDGYKKNELMEDIGLGLYMLSSIPTDKAEPSEALKATIVWSVGLENKHILLSGTQLDLFRRGMPITLEVDVKAVRGAYMLQSDFDLPAGKKKEWVIAADLNKDQSDIAALADLIKSKKNISQIISGEIDQSTENLKIMLAQADANQLTNDNLNLFRHYSNTLFNIMRGGIINNNYYIDKNDFRKFISTTNKPIANKYAGFIEEMPDQSNFHDIHHQLSSSDPDFEKLLFEYLPITFGRRHGDPTRPWNHFSIDIKDEHGNKKLNYQGNWRDIFQNWEALAFSFPGYIENMITKFVNASTADGYNPYRVTRDGFDWEALDPADEWSYIGYWGDHQIIYLLKLLEFSNRYHPGALQSLLTSEIFAYANVPYKIKSYKEIIQDPHNTVDFDYDLDAEIQKRVSIIGTDAKFVQAKSGEIFHVNLAEKILVAMLVKFSNFIPEAGIWMNTQRPEWNDANNALVGYGASMVTLYYIRRYIVFCKDLFNELSQDRIEISEEVSDLFATISEGFIKFRNLLINSISNKDRKKVLDHLGQAGSDHRAKIYQQGFSGERKSLSISDLTEFFELALRYTDHSIRANKREDDLYHAYNIITIADQDEISIRYLYEMLEGQVAVLSSGYLTIANSINLLDSLRKSALYRDDQSSYMLYPNRNLARFTDKNVIPEKQVTRSGLLIKLINQGDRNFVSRDISGKYHFNSEFRNARILKEALYKIKNKNPSVTEDEIQKILDIYESVFDHKSFTGRSGTFYKYEGLGSIYWHMVSKLLLSVQETLYRAVDAGEGHSVITKLKDFYYEIREGIGNHKSPDLYGAFPTDPYSHTPESQGAQQPGMTGQVKEDFISRFGELGVRVQNGKIEFDTALLNKNEFLNASEDFHYYDLTGKHMTLNLKKGMLAFTICQVPVIYFLSKENKIVASKNDGTVESINGHDLGIDISKSVFQRNDKIKKIQVYVNV